MVDDFLNYIIPRTIGLANADELFERYYQQFDFGVCGKSCLVTVQAILHDIYDNSGGGRALPPGFRLNWAVKGPIPLTFPQIRERSVSFFELKKSARPIGRGRDLTDKYGFYVLQYSTQLPKNSNIINSAYRLTHDVVSQFLLAARLKTYSTAYSDYRGFRMLGHLAPYQMNLMNYPDERIEGGESRELHEGDAMAIGNLLQKLLPQPPSKFAVINQKIEDAARRHRDAFINDDRARKLNQIDQLLDYFQVLEAVVPAEGSQYISLYAARLLSKQDTPANQPFELFKFIKDMHTVRNHVMHGRIDEILSGKLKEAKGLDIYRFRHIVYSLVCLYIMNGSLRELATRLALGEKIELKTEYEANQADWMKRLTTNMKRNAEMTFW